MATAAATAQRAHKTTIMMKGVSDFEVIGDITGVTWPGFTTDIIDVTHSLSATREKLAGRVDHGQVTVAINFVPGGTVNKKLYDAAGLLKEFQILEDGVEDSTSAKVTFDAIVQSWAPNQSAEGTVHSGTLTLEVSGPITQAAAS